MSDDVRAVPLDAEQHDFLEELGFQYQRAGDGRTATKLLAICLAWKASRSIDTPFHIDESGGQAEQFSVKVHDPQLRVVDR